MPNDFGAFNERVGISNADPTGVRTAATGIPTIYLTAASLSNTTVDLAIATKSGKTGDQALNYGTVEIAAGAIATGNGTLTLGSGLWPGQVLEFKIAGGLTGYFVVVTITSVIGGQNIFNMNSAGDGLLVRWNGVAWQVLAGRSANITGSVTVADAVLVIPVTHRLVLKETPAGAEALTLAAGTFDGQLITIVLDVAGGGIGTLTPALATGWVAALFEIDGDTLTLEWVDSTIGWVVVGFTCTVAATAVVIT